MQVLIWVILLALVVLAVFAAANWALLTASATLDFLFFTVEGPLGIILLGAMAVLVALLAAYAASVRMTSLVETRRHMKELDAQRVLADKAEASRFTELGVSIEAQMSGLRAAQEAACAKLEGRLDALEHSLRKTLDENAGSLAAHVGQVDDKLDRMSAPGAAARV